MALCNKSISRLHRRLTSSRLLVERKCKQPEGLQESSRWSERSEDHRKKIKISFAPRRVQDVKVIRRRSTISGFFKDR